MMPYNNTINTGNTMVVPQLQYIKIFLIRIDESENPAVAKS